MDKKTWLIHDSYQLDSYGGLTFVGEGFRYRFYSSRKLFWKNIYIPYGPICDDSKGLDNFLNHIESLRFCRIHLDLPLILSSNIENKLKEKLLSYGYKSREYILDNETLLVSPENFHINSRNQRYVKKGLKSFDIKIKKDLTDSEIKEIYNLHLYSSKNLQYNPKPLEAFKEVSSNGMTAIAYDKSTGQVEGFLMGYELSLGENENLSKRILQLVFTSLSEKAKQEKLGFALHSELFDHAFKIENIDIIDFHGASRTQQRSYVEFKKMFGGEFKSHGGAFQKYNF